MAFDTNRWACRALRCRRERSIGAWSQEAGLIRHDHRLHLSLTRSFATMRAEWAFAPRCRRPFGSPYHRGRWRLLKVTAAGPTGHFTREIPMGAQSTTRRLTASATAQSRWRPREGTHSAGPGASTF